MVLRRAYAELLLKQEQLARLQQAVTLESQEMRELKEFMQQV